MQIWQQVGSGYWANTSDGAYTIPKESNFKNYKISGSYTTNEFGTKDVIIPAGGNGQERFYVMALSDIDSSRHYWYYNARGYMFDYATTTSVDFGTGKANTQAMIEKWNSEDYGTQNSNDMWGLIQTQVANGWYVPSRGEWAAFGDAFGITSSNYTNYNLSVICWSSSQPNAYSAWGAYFGDGIIDADTVNRDFYVRLGTTF